MLDYAFQIADFCTRHVNQLDRTHWVWISAVVAVVGFLCMRGFGSRTNY
jgi:hypothetical protein